MSTVAAIVTALKADATIRSLTSNGVRIVDHDIRRSGWEKDTTFFDEDGVIRTSLMVDDAGSTRPAFGHTAEVAGSVYVWAFGPRTTIGRERVATLMDRVQLVMHRWQVPDTGAFVVPVFRLGQQSDDVGGIVDRVTLQVSSVLAVSNF